MRRPSGRPAGPARSAAAATSLAAAVAVEAPVGAAYLQASRNLAPELAQPPRPIPQSAASHKGPSRGKVRRKWQEEGVWGAGGGGGPARSCRRGVSGPRSSGRRGTARWGVAGRTYGLSGLTETWELGGRWGEGLELFFGFRSRGGRLSLSPATPFSPCREAGRVVTRVRLGAGGGGGGGAVLLCASWSASRGHGSWARG
jgi:hypothetical protein